MGSKRTIDCRHHQVFALENHPTIEYSKDWFTNHFFGYEVDPNFNFLVANQ